jgi:hypothetical protein
MCNRFAYGCRRHRFLEVVRFSLACSSSSVFSLLTSDTSIPPDFALHLQKLAADRRRWHAGFVLFQDRNDLLWMTQQKPDPSVRVQIKTNSDYDAPKSFSKVSWTMTDGQNEQAHESTQKSQ